MVIGHLCGLYALGICGSRTLFDGFGSFPKYSKSLEGTIQKGTIFAVFLFRCGTERTRLGRAMVGRKIGRPGSANYIESNLRVANDRAKRKGQVYLSKCWQYFLHYGDILSNGTHRRNTYG